MERALRAEAASEVPCGECTACCTSSQFVHIDADETETLARIPNALVFPAPRSTDGTVVLGYDQHGKCPMLIDDACSIYPHRPRACRTYDCRVFVATGIDLEEDNQSAIAARARRWRFDVVDDTDRVAYDALRAAATLVRDRRDLTSTQRAVFAVRQYGKR